MSKCDKLFATNDSLQRHIPIHQKKRKRKYKCTVCDSKFFYSGDLAYHTLTQHVQTDRVPCPDCDNEYKTKKLMTAHYNDVHLKIKKFKCIVCKERYY